MLSPPTRKSLIEINSVRSETSFQYTIVPIGGVSKLYFQRAGAIRFQDCLNIVFITYCERRRSVKHVFELFDAIVHLQIQAPRLWFRDPMTPRVREGSYLVRCSTWFIYTGPRGVQSSSHFILCSKASMMCGARPLFMVRTLRIRSMYFSRYLMRFEVNFNPRCNWRKWKMGLTYILYASGFHKALSTQSLSYFTQVGPSTATGRGWFSVVDMEVENWSNSENKSRKSIDDLLNLQVWWFLAAIACICVVEINLTTVNVGNNGRADCE